MDTTLSKHECGIGISPIFDSVSQYHVANFSYSIAVLGTLPPQVPLLNNWFDNSCSSINDDCA